MRIGIIGFGFSGLMTAVNLLRETTIPLTLYIVDEHADGLGVAYGTDNPNHLLNVRAGNMSAFADNKNHLIRWLESDAGKYAAAARGLRTDYTALDFIPRALYADYLQTIWREAQEIAAQKECSIKLVPSTAVAVQPTDPIAILTERGDAIAVDRVVLAIGHAPQPILTHLKSANVIQDPWHTEMTDAKHWQSPVIIVGTGLTSIDVLLSLRRAGYAGQVVMTSRRGRLPQVHTGITGLSPITSDVAEGIRTLHQAVNLLRERLRLGDEWRAVIDALRPYTQMIWQRFTARDQMRFQRFLLAIWNLHRHRCAPEIAAQMNAELTQQSLRIVAGARMAVSEDEAGKLSVMLQDETLTPSRIINCTGLMLDIARSTNPLVMQLRATAQIESHITGVGITADKYHRAWGGLYPRMFVLGSMLTGQLLESTAVPELREQAATIAGTCLQSLS